MTYTLDRSAQSLKVWNPTLPQNLLWRERMKILSGARDQFISVLLIDSNQTQSQVLSSALRRRPDFEVSCCPADLSLCLAALESSPADVALLSDGTPGSGNEPYGILRGLHAAHPQMGLVLLRDTYDRELVVNALRCGARGLFCCACQPFKALCRCIHSVHAGQFWVNTEQMQSVIEALMQSPASRVVNTKGEVLLTAREEQLVGLVAEGLINREIASSLRIAENTVKKALLRIYDKLGVSNRVELVLYALTHRDANLGETGSPNVSSRPLKPLQAAGHTRLDGLRLAAEREQHAVLESVS